MQQDMTMGSLFSGSGGFELAASIFGFKPLWASEIEPFPIMVTTTNFPETEHFGNISKMDGAKIPKVTMISGGSPCQDMSVAGLRAGLDGSRSNLFREQIRIVKEMRADDIRNGKTGKYIRPRFMVWENVPGAFSSNKGKDFQSVLQEIAGIVDEEANVPLPPKGKWQSAGCIMGDTYSIAWRVFDAQYWGVPQRRKRIYLVADFGGSTAPKILFEREGLSRDFKESREAWQGTAGDLKTGTHKAGTEDVECYDISDRRRVADRSKVSPTLTSKMGTGGNNVPVVLENHPQDSRVTISEDEIVPTLTGRMGTGGGNVPMIIDEARAIDLKKKPITMQIRSGCEGGGKGALMQIDKSATLSTHNTQTLFEPIPIADKATRNKGGGDTRNDDGAGNGLGVGEPGAPANTLTAADRHAVAYAIDRAAFNQGANAQYNISIQEELAQTLVAKGPGGVSHKVQMEGSVATMTENMGSTQEEWEYIIRRLTPLECCRLQGFPDNWTQDLDISEPTENDIFYWQMVFKEQTEALGETKKEKTANQIRKWLQNPASDSALYKMWGNGIALPCAMFVMEGIAQVLQEENSNESE